MKKVFRFAKWAMAALFLVTALPVEFAAAQTQQQSGQPRAQRQRPAGERPQGQRGQGRRQGKPGGKGVKKQQLTAATIAERIAQHNDKHQGRLADLETIKNVLKADPAAAKRVDAAVKKENDAYAITSQRMNDRLKKAETREGKSVAPSAQKPKSAAEYRAAAQQKINKDNALTQLQSVEEQINKDYTRATTSQAQGAAKGKKAGAGKKAPAGQQRQAPPQKAAAPAPAPKAAPTPK